MATRATHTLLRSEEMAKATHAHTHSQVTKVTHTHTHSYTRRPAEPGGSAYGVGVVGRSLSGVARGQRALLEADDAVGDVRGVRVDQVFTRYMYNDDPHGTNWPNLKVGCH